jgi:hypothetical protein
MKRIATRDAVAQVDALVQQPQTLYKGAIINKRGRTPGKEVPYSEVLAKRLLHTHNLPEALTHLPKLSNGVDFRPTDHDGTTLNPTILGMNQEAHVATALYNHHLLGKLGKVIDYSVPIAPDGKHVGTIDLVSFNPDTATLFVIGYSYHEERRDTLLYCALEIATLRNSIRDDHFIRAYADMLVGLDGNLIHPRDVHIESAMVFLEGSYQDRSVRALKRMPHVADLILELGIRVFVIGIELELRDRPRFTRKHTKYPYKPVFQFLPVLRERSITTSFV